MSTANNGQKPQAIEKSGNGDTFGALRAFLWDRKLHLERMLPPGSVSVDMLLGSAVLAAKKVGALTSCDPESVFLALMDAATLGLTVHWGPRGEAALIPFKKKCQLIIGYRGLIKLMHRSGVVTSVHADVVHENDVWSYSVRESGVRLRHEPVDVDGGPVRLYYAAAYLRSGGCQVARLLRDKAERIRSGQLSKLQDWQVDDSPYTLWPEEMGIKGAVRQLAKWLPSEDVERALEIEDKHETVIGEARRVEIVPKTTAPALPEPRPVEVIEPARETEKVTVRPTELPPEWRKRLDDAGDDFAKQVLLAKEAPDGLKPLVTAALNERHAAKREGKS